MLREVSILDKEQTILDKLSPDRYGRRPYLYREMCPILCEQQRRKHDMLDSLSAVTWGQSSAVELTEVFNQHKYNYTMWLWLSSFDHETSVQYFNRIVKPYHDQNRDLIYMFGSYVL